MDGAGVANGRLRCFSPQTSRFRRTYAEDPAIDVRGEHSREHERGDGHEKDEQVWYLRCDERAAAHDCEQTRASYE